ncbi:MAG: hypothetical protein DRJ60_05135 [Thermoprotei archaeon]|nr:MAG: hypothetical protein DRJ60_05135 [Thermoprotei archaeon]
MSSRKIWRGYAKKVTSEVKEKMIRLRSQGLSYRAIARILGLSPTAVYYHLNEEYRLRDIARAAERRIVKPEDAERKAKYIAERYREDQEFKERVKRHARESMKRKRLLKKELREKYPEYHEALKTYSREAKQLGEAEAWKRHKARIDELRRKYGVDFPY